MRPELEQMLAVWERLRGDWQPRMVAHGARRGLINGLLFFVGFMSVVFTLGPLVIPMPEPVQNLAGGILGGMISGWLVTRAIQVTDEGRALTNEGRSLQKEIELLGEELDRQNREGYTTP